MVDPFMQEADPIAGDQRLTPPRIRAAESADAPRIAQILAQAFPSLYLSAFGVHDIQTTETLLTALYEAGSISLETTRLAIRDERVVGVAILHIGLPIGRGSIGVYWRAVRRAMGGWLSLRAFFGGIAANVMLNGRIPRADDLVYVEALAVSAGERGKGIGSLLLEDAVNWARERRRSRLALHVLTMNQGARRLYERFGFRPWRQTTRFQWVQNLRPGSDWGAILMEKKIQDVEE